MYLRQTRRTNRDGSTVSYLQLAHNERHPVTGAPTAKVIHNFGRADKVDREALSRLVSSISRFLTPEQAVSAAAGVEVEVIDSRRLGSAWTLDRVWERLGIGAAIRRVAEGRRLDGETTERVIFALVANRALEPLSKLAATRWVTERVWVPGLGEVSDDACYRAMDWLLEVQGELAEQVYWATADLLNLEVDLLFFDTTSTYFQTEQADPPAAEDPEATVGFRAYGNSKDHRGDLPQVVIGMAVTRTGIPIRVWCWPGNSGDSALIRQVKDDLRAWKLSRVVWVADRGFSSAENRRYLQRAGGHYIIGEKLRGDSKEAAAALSRQGRYHTVAGNLAVKEVVIDEGVMRDRFIICRNPDQAARDRAVRAQLLAHLSAAIGGSDTWTASKRATTATELRAKKGLEVPPVCCSAD